MKKLLFYILIIIALVGIFTVVNAQTTTRLGTCTFTNGRAPASGVTEPSCTMMGAAEGGSRWTYTGMGTVDRLPGATDYKFLAPLPCDNTDPNCSSNGKLESFNSESPNALGNYINLLIKLIIGISAVMAVVMIVIGGVEYMTSELISGKEDGKHRIQQAVLGLLLALGSWALLNTINPKLLDTEIKIANQEVKVELNIEEQIANRAGQGSCQVIADSSSPCSPANLTAGGFNAADARQASAICYRESRGQPTLASGVDKCSDGSSFSYGLFQINILSHANNIPGGVCSNIFEKTGSGLQGNCLERKNGVCIRYDCKVTNQSKYQSCVSYITNPTNIIKYSSDLQKSTLGWSPWRDSNGSTCSIN